MRKSLNALAFAAAAVLDGAAAGTQSRIFDAQFKIPVSSAGGHELTAEPVAFDGAMWKLILYPMGYRAGARAGFCSVYLEMLRARRDGAATDRHESSSHAAAARSAGVCAARSYAFSVALLAAGPSRDLPPAARRFCESHNFNELPRWGFIKFVDCRTLNACAARNDGSVTLRLTMAAPGTAAPAARDAPDEARGRKRRRFGWWPLRGRKQTNSSSVDSSGSSSAGGTETEEQDGEGKEPQGDDNEPNDAVAAPAGLHNQGNTCYLNSLLQTFYAAPEFREVVTESDAAPPGTVSSALQAVFRGLKQAAASRGRASASTSSLTSVMGVDVRVQQDAHEFGRFLVSSVEAEGTDAAAAPAAAPAAAEVAKGIRRLFVGKMQNYLNCVNVPFGRQWSEDFYDISLDVRGSGNIAEALDRYTKPELMDGDNQWRTKEHGLQDALKGVHFLSFPPVLQFHLKRFEYDPATGHMAKLNERFEFPTTLDVRPWLHKQDKDQRETPAPADKAPSQRQELEHGNEQQPAAAGGESEAALRYRLNAVLMHVGGPAAGHYYAYVRNAATGESGSRAAHARSQGEGGGAAAHWFKVDDDRVARVSEAEVLRDAYGGGGGAAGLMSHVWSLGGAAPSAYILQYSAVGQEGGTCAAAPAKAEAEQP